MTGTTRPTPERDPQLRSSLRESAAGFHKKPSMQSITVPRLVVSKAPAGKRRILGVLGGECAANFWLLAGCRLCGVPGMKGQPHGDAQEKQEVDTPN